MKKTLLVILALVMDLILVMGSVSAASARTTLPSLNVALTKVYSDENFKSNVNVTCTANMLEDLTGTLIGNLTVPSTGGTATGKFNSTDSYKTSDSSLKYNIMGNVIYMSVGKFPDSDVTGVWVTVQITKSNLYRNPYLLAYFDSNNNFYMMPTDALYYSYNNPDTGTTYQVYYSLHQYWNEDFPGQQGVGKVSVR